MLKVTSRTQIQVSGQSTQIQIEFRQDLPNRLKSIVNALYNPVPSYFNAKLLRSQHCAEILYYVISWPALQSFYPHTTKSSTHTHTPLLKQLTVISFPNLQYLYLENMKLDNFQFLQFIDSPNLKTLYLMENHARILKSLVKVEWGKLQKVEISCDFGVQEMKCIQRMRFGLNGKVINPIVGQDLKRRKKVDESKPMNSLWMIWPKLEPKQYGYLVEEMLKKRLKMQ